MNPSIKITNVVVANISAKPLNDLNNMHTKTKSVYLRFFIKTYKLAYIIQNHLIKI